MARLVLALSTVLLCLASASDARAQAWVDDPGSLTAGFDYSYATSDHIIETDGGYYPPGDAVASEPIVNHSFLLRLEYTPIESLAIEASLPLLMTRYGGTGEAFAQHGDYDDGDSHFFAQDFRLGARYQLFGPYRVVTPHLAVTVPASDYETQGFAGGGRGLKKAHAGLSAGALLAPWVPRLFVHGRYEFSLSESYTGDDENFFTGMPVTEAEEDILADYGQNSSDLGFLIGYFITDDFQLYASFDMHWQHGGVNFSDTDLEPIAVQYHDPLLDEDFMLVGGGASYQLLDNLSLTAFVRLWLDGQNTRDPNVFGAGLSWDVL